MMDKPSLAASFATQIPAPGEGKRGRAGYLTCLLRQANAAVRLTMERALADLGATPPQFAVLTMINAYSGVSGADLARLVILTPQTVGVITRNLERSGAIIKQKHPVHGRVLQWALTAKGKKLLTACRARAHAVEAQVAALLPSKSEPALRAWLAALATDLVTIDC
jgi:DNA-binding MarR family transcriptional regulator